MTTIGNQPFKNNFVVSYRIYLCEILLIFSEYISRMKLVYFVRF